MGLMLQTFLYKKEETGTNMQEQQNLYGREVFSILSESKDSKSESTVFSTLATWYKHLHLTPLLFLTGV